MAGDAMDPYLLESFVEGMGDEQSAEVKLAVLAACARMFFLRPAQCQRLLGGALAAGAADPDQDVHDRALLYYRLLKHAAPEAARDVLVAHSGGLGSFAESHATQVKNRSNISPQRTLEQRVARSTLHRAEERCVSHTTSDGRLLDLGARAVGSLRLLTEGGRRVTRR